MHKASSILEPFTTKIPRDKDVIKREMKIIVCPTHGKIIPTCLYDCDSSRARCPSCGEISPSLSAQDEINKYDNLEKLLSVRDEEILKLKEELETVKAKVLETPTVSPFSLEKDKALLEFHKFCIEKMNVGAHDGQYICPKKLVDKITNGYKITPHDRQKLDNYIEEQLDKIDADVVSCPNGTLLTGKKIFKKDGKVYVFQNEIPVFVFDGKYFPEIYQAVVTFLLDNKIELFSSINVE